MRRKHDSGVRWGDWVFFLVLFLVGTSKSLLSAEYPLAQSVHPLLAPVVDGQFDDAVWKLVTPRRLDRWEVRIIHSEGDELYLSLVSSDQTLEKEFSILIQVEKGTKQNQLTLTLGSDGGLKALRDGMGIGLESQMKVTKGRTAIEAIVFWPGLAGILGAVEGEDLTAYPAIHLKLQGGNRSAQVDFRSSLYALMAQSPAMTAVANEVYLGFLDFVEGFTDIQEVSLPYMWSSKERMEKANYLFWQRLMFRYEMAFYTSAISANSKQEFLNGLQCYFDTDLLKGSYFDIEPRKDILGNFGLPAEGDLNLTRNVSQWSEEDFKRYQRQIREMTAKTIVPPQDDDAPEPSNPQTGAPFEIPSKESGQEVTPSPLKKRIR